MQQRKGVLPVESRLSQTVTVVEQFSCNNVIGSTAKPKTVVVEPSIAFLVLVSVILGLSIKPITLQLVRGAT